jgi:zinc protease
VQAIGQDDLFEFHRRHYGPHGMLIAIVGGIDPSLGLEKISAAFGDWVNPLQAQPPELPPLVPLTEITTQHVEVAGKSQADLLIGAAGPPRSSPDYMAASLGNHVLGRFGMMGRLGESLREKAGLAYYAGSSLNSGLGPGPWDASAGVDPENIERAAELILTEIRRFVSEPVSAGELADSQANYIGRLPISLESNGGIASAILSLERHQLGLDYYQRFPDLVSAVTPQDVMEAAGRYLDPDRLAIASAGPGERIG